MTETMTLVPQNSPVDPSGRRAGRVFLLSFIVLAAGIVTATLGVVALLGWGLKWPLLASFGADLMPMAPSTAVLFLSYGVVIGLRARMPLTRHAYGISMATVYLGAMAALLLLALACVGIQWPGEHLGLNITGAVRGAPTGHMSPVTAFCFLLASVSFLASLSRSVIRPWRTALASGSAGVLLGTCLIFVLAYFCGTPLLYGGRFIPPAINTALAFVVMGLALLALAGWPGWLFRRSPGDDSRPSFVFALIFLLLTAGIITTGYFYYRNYEQKYREEVEHQLSAIADLEVNELVQYRKERMADASLLFENASFSALVQRVLEKPEDLDAQHMLRTWINKYQAHPDYDRVFLVDTQGVRRVSVPDTAEPMDHYLLDQVRGALRLRQVVFLDFHREAEDAPIRLAMLVPIFDESDAKRPLGVMVLRIDPKVYLYPFLSRWPTPSRSAETLLVRREGNAVLFLNELKFQTNMALNLRIPLAKADGLAVKATLGQEGVVEGKDYRGMPVIGDIRAVPGSPWFLAARMDRSEVYTPMRARLWQLVLFVGILIFGASAFIGLVWRQQTIRFYRERYNAAEALRASEVRYRRLFESAKDGVLILDVETGTVVDVNPFLIELLGFSREGFLGKTIWELGFFKDIVASQASFVELQQKEYVRYDNLPLESADGRRIKVEFVSNTYLADHCKGIQCNIRDITGRVRAEEFIRKLNRVYAMLSNINQAIVRIREPQALYEEACRIAVEDGGFRMAWIGLADPTSGRVLPTAHAGVTDGYLEKLDNVLGDDTWGREPTGSAMRTGERMVCNDIENDPHMTPLREEVLRNGYHSSATFPLKVSGEVRGAFGLYAAEPGFFDDEEVKLLDELAMDIGFAMEFAVREAERKQAEEKLVQNCEMATAMNALLSLSMEDGTVAEFLERALNLIISIKWLAFGDAKGSIFLADDKGEELRMQAVHKLPKALRVKCERVPFGYCICGRAAAAREVQFADYVDGRHETQYDDMVPHGHYCVPILSGDRVLGVINLYVKVGHAHNPQEEEFLKAVANTLAGVIQRKQAEEALRKSNKELAKVLQQLRETQAKMVHEERMSALGQMASGIAHDFNNVLVPIVGYSEILVSQPDMLDNRDEALSFLKDINTAAHDARQIVQRLRLIRGSDAKDELVPADVNEIARSAVEMTRPRWDKEMGAKGCRINIVPLLEADKQVLGNESELREALINLILNAVDAMPKGGTLTLSSAVENDDVILVVADTGEGMTDEAKERCFEPFFTTKGVKGTGLGLSMVHGIVTRHNGTMKIDSTLGQGTTVLIRLPCAPVERAAKESRKGGGDKDFVVAPLRILVADDDAKSRNLVECFLTKDRHIVEMARTGREAIDKAKAGTFDLVITDRSMPEANGDLVALSVKARTPETPVILLTGFGDIMKHENECPVGVDRILTKPVTRADLRGAIAKVMARKERRAAGS